MSYTPTEWEPTDVVTATRMNALEQAVGDMNMSYTPNVWSDGDILSADKMNALEQAVASGGGSSDFSTATVTVINNSDAPVQVNAPLAIVNGEYKFSGFFELVEPGTEILNVVLYFGECTSLVNESNISVSGNAELDDGYVVVTGDCTITISGGK